MTERLRILFHSSNYFQTLEIMEKMLSDSTSIFSWVFFPKRVKFQPTWFFCFWRISRRVTERLRILIHTCLQLQTLEIIEKTLSDSDKNELKKHLPNTRCPSKWLVHNCYAHVSTRRRPCGVPGLHTYAAIGSTLEMVAAVFLSLCSSSTSSNPLLHIL